MTATIRRYIWAIGASVLIGIAGLALISGIRTRLSVIGGLAIRTADSIATAKSIRRRRLSKTTRTAYENYLRAKRSMRLSATMTRKTALRSNDTFDATASTGQPSSSEPPPREKTYLPASNWSRLVYVGRAMVSHGFVTVRPLESNGTLP